MVKPKSTYHIYGWILTALIFIIGTQGAAFGQAPVVDGATKPGQAVQVMRPVPRSLKTSGSFDRTNLVETPRLDVQQAAR